MSTTDSHRGLFLTFEGIDGSGKTTQMRLLAERLRRAGHEVLESYEPGGTRIGTQVRRILLDSGNQELCPTAELLLYFACRAQNVDQWILPALREGKVVLSDRFTDSSLVYQGVGRGLGRDVVLALDKVACRGLVPDLSLLIEIDLETSLARAQLRNRTVQDGGGVAETRMDDQDFDFHRRVRDAYAELAASEPRRFAVIDGRHDVGTVARAVWETVKGRLTRLYV